MKYYWVLSNGRLSREDNTVHFTDSDGAESVIPIDSIECLHLYGEVDLNTKVLNFIAQKGVTVHLFNYYGYYSGSWYPRESPMAVTTLMRQCELYSDSARRVKVASGILHGAARSMEQTLNYYLRRQPDEPETVPEDAPDLHGAEGVPVDEELEAAVNAPLPPDDSDETPDTVECAPGPLRDVRDTIRRLGREALGVSNVQSLRGVEGKIRAAYYTAFPLILQPPWTFSGRNRRPPRDEINALISFLNCALYGACNAEVFRTRLHPAVSFLHDAQDGRLSLGLDVAEVFKPIIVDRLIFRMANTHALNPGHFRRADNACLLNEEGKRIVVSNWNKRLSTTIFHRRIRRHVSYRHLLRMECHALANHVDGIAEYRAFRAWW